MKVTSTKCWESDLKTIDELFPQFPTRIERLHHLVCDYKENNLLKDIAILRRHRKIREQEELIKDLNKEIRRLDQETDEGDRRIKTNTYIEKIYEMLCSGQKEGKIINGLELVRMMTDIKEYYKDLAELKAKELIKPIRTEYNGANPEKPMKECQNCEQKFNPKRSDQKYCSSECSQEAKILKAEQKRAEYQDWYNKNMLGLPPNFDHFRGW